MSEVSQWDPRTRRLSEDHRLILNKASRSMDSSNLGLSIEEQTKLIPALKFSPEAWLKFTEEMAVEELVDWIKVLTLCEFKLQGFDCGAKSPVIPLARRLKQQKKYPVELTTWIRKNSKNRFLPYGSLLDLI